MDAGPKQDLWNLLPVIIVLLLGAAYFAIMETAFSSASRIRLKAAADHGNRRAGQALYVLDHFDQAITTLLIGTNILHLTIATIVTVAVQRVWGMWAVTAATLVTTVVVFFAGEMLPKSIAKKYAERLAMATARSLRFFMVLFQPLSVLLTAIGNAAARCIRGEPAVTVTEDELADIIENMTDDGELTAERGELMSSALSFAEVPVESVITARVDVAAVDVDDPPEEILAYVREQRHSRLPVYADSVDNVIGILQIRKYIKACIKAGGKAVDIRPLLDEPVFVHQSTLIAEVLPELSRRKANLAIVTDNYGGTLGIVTKLYLKLLPKPESSASVLVGYPSLDAALSSMSKVFAAGILPCAVEFMNETVLEILSRTGDVPWPDTVKSLLLFQVDGSRETVPLENARLAAQLDDALWSMQGVGKEEEDRLWAFRRRVSSSSYVLGPDRIGGDMAVPRGSLLKAVRRFEAIAASHGKRLIGFGHAGDGNIHANLHYDASDPDDARRTAAAHHALDDAALEFGGSLSGEHGGGCLKDVGKQLGADELEAMRAVRRLFDPQGILNPGKGY